MKNKRPLPGLLSLMNQFLVCFHVIEISFLSLRQFSCSPEKITYNIFSPEMHKTLSRSRFSVRKSNLEQDVNGNDWEPLRDLWKPSTSPHDSSPRLLLILILLTLSWTLYRLQISTTSDQRLSNQTSKEILRDDDRLLFLILYLILVSDSWCEISK